MMSESTNRETKIFAAQLNEWRTSHGLRESELSRILKTSRQVVHDVLIGRRSFSAEKALLAMQTLYRHDMATAADKELDVANKKAKELLQKSSSRIMYFQSFNPNK
jgi:predicted transcriptional regulator